MHVLVELHAFLQLPNYSNQRHVSFFARVRVGDRF